MTKLVSSNLKHLSNRDQITDVLIDRPESGWNQDGGTKKETVYSFTAEKNGRDKKKSFSQKILYYPLFFHLHQIPTLLTVYNEKLSVSTNYISSEFLFPVLFKLYCCKLAMKSN